MNQKQLADLEADIEQDKEELRRLRHSLDGLASPNLDGMPHGTDISRPVENTVERLAALEEALHRKNEARIKLKTRIEGWQTSILLERDRLMRYIETIPDSHMRQIFTLRFVNGLQWQQVAASLGEGYMGESVRVSCYRFLRCNRHKGK